MDSLLPENLKYIPVIAVGLVSGGLFLFLRWQALYGGGPPSPAKREWRYKNYSEAAAAISSAHPELPISDEEMKRLAMLHFYGWDIAQDSGGQQLALVRGTEEKSFPIVVG